MVTTQAACDACGVYGEDSILIIIPTAAIIGPASAKVSQDVSPLTTPASVETDSQYRPEDSAPTEEKFDGKT